jgi:hypothetical protein
MATTTTFFKRTPGPLLALPWYLGGSFWHDAGQVLAHVAKQYAILGYNTFTLVYEPAFWFHMALLTYWAIEKYHPWITPPSATVSTHSHQPYVDICGQRFQVRSLGWANELHPSPPFSKLATALGHPPPYPFPEGVRLVPVSPSPFIHGAALHRPEPPPLVEFTLSFQVHFDFKGLVFHYTPYVEPTITQTKEGFEAVYLFTTTLPQHVDRWEQWRQGQRIIKFFTEMFTSGQMPIG